MLAPRRLTPRQTRGWTLGTGGFMNGGMNSRASSRPIWCSSMWIWGNQSW